MSPPPPEHVSRKIGLRVSSAFLIASALAAIWCLDFGGASGSRAALPVVHPDLFVSDPQCPRQGAPATAAARAEAGGRARANRYPYDPVDGVLAVHQYRLAAHCHELAGRAVAAGRLRALANALSARVDVDYAAARLDLLRAREARDWHAVLREAQHLRRLTSQLGQNDYTEWLDRTSGKARAELRREP
ncbi:MAG: hypothetical protein AAF500_16620 [Myxococcota bacterium]